MFSCLEVENKSVYAYGTYGVEKKSLLGGLVFMYINVRPRGLKN